MSYITIYLLGLIISFCIIFWVLLVELKSLKNTDTVDLAIHVFFACMCAFIWAMIWPITLILSIIYGICYLIAKYIIGNNNESDTDQGRKSEYYSEE